MDNKMSEYGSLKKAEKEPILLVEDYESNIFVASLYLEELGYKYEIARNGNEAFDKFKSQKYSIILMDVEMPDLNGIEATRLIREYEAKENLASTSIIGITAHAFTAHRESCLNAGMSDYISKPVTLAVLKAKLEHFLNT